MAEHRLLDFAGSLFRHSSYRRPRLDATDSRPWPRSSQDILLSRVCAFPRRLWGCSSIATGVSRWGRKPDNPSRKRSRSCVVVVEKSPLRSLAGLLENYPFLTPMIGNQEVHSRQGFQVSDFGQDF